MKKDKFVYMRNGKQWTVADKQKIWSLIDEEHRDFIREMIDVFDAKVIGIKSGNNVYRGNTK